jgi:hypothetical protein
LLLAVVAVPVLLAAEVLEEVLEDYFKVFLLLFQVQLWP